MTEFDVPLTTGVSWKGGPVIAEAEAPRLELALDAALPVAVLAAADIVAPLASGTLLPLAAGEPDAIAEQEPCSSTAGIGSATPTASTAIVTVLVPSPASVRVAPPVTLLASCS